MPLKDRKILIVGLGLIGGSYAEALKRKGFEVGAVTRSQASVDYALEHGMIDCGTTEVTPGFLGRYDLVVFALYPHVLLEWVEKYQQFLKPGALLTDVTGVKSAVVYKVQEMLRDDLEFVGAHPMAGREVYGVRNADSSIFVGANYIVTPTPNNSEAAVQDIEELGRILGFSRISRLSPGKHDEMWSELFLLNRDELLSQLDLFIGQMGTIRDAVSDGDTEKLRALMRLSTERRALFDK